MWGLSACAEGWRARALAAALHLGIALVLTFPMVLTFGSRLLGHPDIDVWNHAWGPWWFWHTLSHGVLPYRTDLLAAPEGGLLWYIDPLGALLGAPLVPLVGVVAAYNAVILANVALASAAARGLARALGASRVTSWVAAAAFAGSSYLLCEVHNGVSELVGVAWPLFALAAGIRALGGGGWRAWAASGAWLALATIGTWYYGVAVAVALCVLALPWLARRPARADLGGLALAVGLTVALVAPAAWAVLHAIHAPDAVVLRGAVGDADRLLLASHNAVDPRAFFAPGGFQSVDLKSGGEAFLHASYLGLLALGLALSTRRWAPLAAAAVLCVFSLGPALWWAGHWVVVARHPFPLPYAALSALLPGAGATHAQRLVMPAIALVAALAAVRIATLPRRLQLLIGAALVCDALLASGAPWPIARAPALDTAAHQWIAGQPIGTYGERPVGSVLDLPPEVGATMATSRYLTCQTVHGRPIPYRPDARGDTSTLLRFASFRVLAVMSASREAHRRALWQSLDRTTAVEPDELARAGFAWIVVHRELERGGQHVAAMERQLERWFGPPRVFGEHAVYATIPPEGADGRVLPFPEEVLELNKDVPLPSHGE